MPYPLPEQPTVVGGARVRLLPPVGCPGLEQWVLPMDQAGWLELGYRLGSIPADELELFWLPADRRWNEPLDSAAIELLINPRQSIPGPIAVSWGDGSSDAVPWPATSSSALRLRHVYAQRADVTVQVQMGARTATLSVALLGCPLVPVGGGSGAGGERPARVYTGQGRPPATLQPPPAPGDVFLDLQGWRIHTFV